MPSATITKIWNRPNGSASRRLGMSVSMIASDRTSDRTCAAPRADDAGFRRSAAEAAIDRWAGSWVGPWSLAASRENALPADETIIKRSPVRSGNAPAPSAVPIALLRLRMPRAAAGGSLPLFCAPGERDSPNGAAAILGNEQSAGLVDGHANRSPPNPGLVNYEAG